MIIQGKKRKLIKSKKQNIKKQSKFISMLSMKILNIYIIYKDTNILICKQIQAFR